MPAKTFAACIAIALSLVTHSEATTYTAPRDGLDAPGMSYQLGIWAAILLVAIALYGFYSLGSIDYSGDAALFVDPQSSDHN